MSAAPASHSASQDKNEDRATLECKHPGILLIAVMGVSIIQFLDMTIANVALPHMQSSLGASIDTITWVLTSYIIAGVVMMPISGWLSDRFGSRRLYLWSVTGFILTSMLCGAATSLPQMVLFRTLQGVTSAFVTPLSQTIIFDTNAPSKQPKAVTLWGMVIMLAPISGPVIGGVLTETLNWRWVFYINLPIGIPALVLLFWLLPSRPLVDRKLDKLGFLMLAIGLGALQLMLDRGQHKDWLQSWEIIIELMVICGAFWIFMTHSMMTKNPLFPGALVKNGNFIASAGFMAVLGMANVALTSLLPTMFQSVYQYDVIETGMLMVPRAVGLTITMLITTRIMSRIDMRYLVVMGYLIAAYALWMMSQWSLEMGRWPIMSAGFIMGLGLGFISTPINLVAFATLAPQHRPDGTSLLTLVRNLGSSFGISIIVTLLARNSQISHADIAANVTSSSVSGFDLSATTQQLGDAGSAVMQMINGEVSRQAIMVAYIDNFYALAWFILFVAPLAMLLKPMRIYQNSKAPITE